jgi:hypothetical protein
MDKSHADAIAQALLEPDLKAQETLRLKRAAEARQLAEKRSVAWWVLAGGAIGAVVAYAVGQRITSGVLWGCMAGSVVGWGLVGWHRRR